MQSQPKKLNALPKNETIWLEEAKKYGAELSMINTKSKVESASKFTDVDFLMIRALWLKPRSIDDDDRTLYTLIQDQYLEKAVAHLNVSTNKAWSEFLKRIPLSIKALEKTPKAEVGEFIDTLDLNAVINGTKETMMPTPYMQLRPRRARAAIEVEDQSLFMIRKSAFDPIFRQPIARNAIRFDEQTPNVALWSLLKNLGTDMQEVRGVWTLTQRSFFPPSTLAIIPGRKDKRKGVYEARPDGALLSCHGGHVLGIMEVKARRRFRGQSEHDDPDIAILKQEAAELAAWIAEDPPKNWEKKTEAESKAEMIRLLVAQDRDELFINVGTFDVRYVKWIRGLGSVDAKAPRSFLKIQTFGPFRVADKKHMQMFGEIMLGFTLQETARPPRLGHSTF